MKKPTIFLINVDGSLTDGKFYYNHEGKVIKAFGPDDHEALKLLRPHLEVHFVSADHRGFEISQARIVRDMDFPLHCVSPLNRPHWIKRNWDPEALIYMGSGIFDYLTFHTVAYGISPSDGDTYSKRFADYVTESHGGKRAVAQACFHILQTFFGENFRESFLSELAEAT